MHAAFTFVDLFAGIGGFHAALSALGGECVYAVEVDHFAASTYERNWGRPGGRPVLGDVTNVAGDDPVSDVVPDHDVLAAGFPCQPFSKSGSQRGMEEIRGTLFFNVMNIIKARQPKVVLLENVRNLAGPRHRHEWDVIVSLLHKEGYRISATPAILSPHRIPPDLGGRPQVRERVFISATRNDGSPDLVLPPSETAPPSLSFASMTPEKWDITTVLSPKGDPDLAGTALSASERDWIEAWHTWVEYYRSENAGANPPSFPIWSDDWRTTAELDAYLNRPENRHLPNWKVGFLRKNAALYDSHNRHWLDKWLLDFGIADFRPSRRKLEWQAGDARLKDCLVQPRPSGIRVKPPTYAPSLVAITQTSIYAPMLRRLSFREAARLQGLPDEFIFPEDQPVAVSYRQMGNGVNVGAVWNVFKSHCRRDSDLLNQTPRGRSILAAATHAPECPDELLRKILHHYAPEVSPHLAQDSGSIPPTI